MSNSIVQKTIGFFNSQQASPLTVTGHFSGNTTAGNLLVAICTALTAQPGAGVTPTIAAPSTPGFTWTLAAQSTNPNAELFFGNYYESSEAIYIMENAPSMSPSAITTLQVSAPITGSGFIQAGFALLEVSGLSPSAVIDQIVVQIGSSGTPSAGNLVVTGVNDWVLVAAYGAPSITGIYINPGFTQLSDGTFMGVVEHILDAPAGLYSAGFEGTTSDPWIVIGISFFGVPPPPFSCAPVGPNGVVVGDLSLYIGPATALYETPVPTTAIAVSESYSQGRSAIILDFNDSEGLYARDLGVVFTWPISSGTILDLCQPSIIPMDDDVYQRMSFHFLMKSLGLTGWGHIRELNLAYSSTTPLTLLLTFDQWPSITLTIPSSSGNEIKQKIVLPPNKFKLVEGFLSSSSPFLLWTSDSELKLGEWGRTEGYRVLKAFS